MIVYGSIYHIINIFTVFAALYEVLGHNDKELSLAFYSQVSINPFNIITPKAMKLSNKSRHFVVIIQVISLNLSRLKILR